MFKFDFSKDDTKDILDDVAQQNTIEWFECQEIFPEEVHFENNYNSRLINCPGVHVKYISDEDVIRKITHERAGNEIANSLMKAEESHSDLVTAVYEGIKFKSNRGVWKNTILAGGLKIWECTLDLLNFLSNKNIDLNNKKILDLGCGAGIIGIYAGLKGAKVVFQDYNVEVIQNLTIPNVLLNKINFEKCAFYSGDWKSFLCIQREKLEENEKYDYIFTSETIYNVDNYKKICDIFQHLLKKNGTIYLAAKYHYFGVGGGISAFEDALRKEDIFDHSTCWSCLNGIKREIIKITLK